MREIQNTLRRVGTPLKKKTKELRDMHSIWKMWNLENKKTLLKNIFPKWIPINANKSVGTPSLSLIYQQIKDWKTSFFDMVIIGAIGTTFMSLEQEYMHTVLKE